MEQTTWQVRVRALCDARAWTLGQLAARLGCDRVTVQNWATGKHDPLPIYQETLRELERGAR